MRWLVEKSVQANHDEAPRKRILCRELNMDVAAVADGGALLAMSPNGKFCLSALRKALWGQMWLAALRTGTGGCTPHRRRLRRGLRSKGFEMLPDDRMGKGLYFPECTGQTGGRSFSSLTIGRREHQCGCTYT